MVYYCQQKSMSQQPKIDFFNRTLKEKIIIFISLGFGTGFIKFAPGTWGTLPGVAFAYFLMPYPIIHILSIIIISLVGIWFCDKASEILKVHDYGGIVIDEIAGVMITFLFFTPSWYILILGFIWFRFFDIIKPFPIRWIDKKVSGGFGIMVDDTVAGIFAWISLWISIFIIEII